MAKKRRKTVKCQICKKSKSLDEVLPAELVRGTVADIMKSQNPDWSPEGYICFADLNQYRTEYLNEILEKDKGELSSIEQDVMKSFRKQKVIANNINKKFETELTFSQRLADSIAEIGGSWKFIIFFGAFILLWVCTNVVALFTRPFDPYPFILLNLVLSCLAAVQAPIIMMSQNRQEAKDRLRSEEDYKTNLKSELMIHHLNMKVDQLLSNQWQRLLEIQQMQMDLIEEALQKKTKQ